MPGSERDVDHIRTLLEGFRHIDWQTVLGSVETLARDHEQLLTSYRKIEHDYRDLRKDHEHLRRAHQECAEAEHEGEGAGPARRSGPEERAALRCERLYPDQTVEALASQRHGLSPSDVIDELARRRIGERSLIELGHLAFQDLDDGIFVKTVLDCVMRALDGNVALVILRDDAGHFTRSSKGDPTLLGEVSQRLPAAFDELLTRGGHETVPLVGSNDASTALAVLIPGPGGVRGILAVGRASEARAFRPDEQEFLRTFTQTTAVALDRRLLRQNIELDLLDAVALFVTALETKDPHLQGHAARVSLYAGEIAVRLSLTPAQVTVTRRAGLLHDLGKLMILDAIRLKAGRLTKEEYARMRQSPLMTAQILRPLPFLASEVAAVRHHLERYDGTGYPDGLKGEAIPLPGRILTVADAFDAMTSPRPYRTRLPIHAALTEIQRLAGSQFDPHVVQAFTSITLTGLTSIGRSYRRTQGTAGRS